MKNIKIWQIIAILLFLVNSAHSQKRAYIATDSTTSTGVQLISGTVRNNGQFIRYKSKDLTMKYYPDQLTEYGLSNGTVYKSKIISVSGQPKKVFLERIATGKINLYYYTEKGFKTFFLEKDSTVYVEIEEGDDFRTMIIENTKDFEWKANQLQTFPYNRNSLSTLISMYNSGNSRPLPYTRFGITAGVSRMSLTVPEAMTDEQHTGISFSPRSAVSFGVFTDLPIAKSNFSLNAGVNFSKYEFNAQSTTAEPDADGIVKFTSLNLPVLLRYTLPTLVWRPFINAGGIYSYHVKYYDSLGPNPGSINLDNPDISRGLPGYSVGLGLQRNTNYRQTASIELRYNHLTGNKDKYDMNHLEVLVGFSF